MSLFTDPLGIDTPPEPSVPRIYSENYRHSIVDSSWQPEQSLLSMVEGVPVRVEYYRQRLARDEEPAPFGPNLAPTYQKYDRIKNLIVKQEGGGAFSFDPANGESTKVYNGWVIFDLTPNRGDCFVVDIGDGRAGLMHITEQPEPRNFTANKVFYITYQMSGILDRDTFEKLDSRVIEDLIYSKDSQLNGGLSVIATTDFNDTKRLFDWRTTIANYIMHEFYWSPEKTIAFESSPGQMVYDQYLVNFLAAMIPPDLRPMYPFINQFSTEYGGRDFGKHGDINIWTVLLRGDFNLLPICDKEAAMIGVNRAVGTRMYGNIRNTKFEYFIATDPERYKLYKAYFNFDGFPILRPSPEVPVTYMFSEEFYKGNWTTKFEQLVLETLKNHVVDRKGLLEYCDTYFNLPKREQLYQGAILLLLLNVARKVGGSL